MVSPWLCPNRVKLGRKRYQGMEARLCDGELGARGFVGMSGLLLAISTYWFVETTRTHTYRHTHALPLLNCASLLNDSGDTAILPRQRKGLLLPCEGNPPRVALILSQGEFFLTRHNPAFTQGQLCPQPCRCGTPWRDTSLYVLLLNLLGWRRTELLFHGPEHPFNEDTAVGEDEQKW